MSPAYAALDALMQIAGRERPQWAVIEGGANAMKTRFYAEEAAAAALAAIGVAAADLWTLRTGETQEVRVSTREAAAALVSFALQTFGDPALAPPARPDDAGAGSARGTPAMGFFPTSDGRWVFLHPSFPDSAARLHAMLGAPADRDAVAAEAMRWTAQDLENAIADAGLCGAMARSPEEWDDSEQGRILAATPVVEVVRFADSPPEALSPAPDAPLSGFRVLDLTRVLAGPTCARTLAQHGAEVLYVSSPNLPTTEWFVSDTNPGKRACYLDLAAPGDADRLRELVRGCDVFSQGYRAGALARMGFGPLELARLRPGVICTSVNAYGHEGLWAGRPGWEQLAQTVTGMAVEHGQDLFDSARGPVLQPGAVTDYTTGFLAALGSMIALRRRALYGGSYLVRVSLSRTAMWVRSLGRGPASRLQTAEAHAPAELASWMIDMPQGGFGPIRRLRPTVRMSKTPAEWRLPVSRLGAHPAEWERERAAASAASPN
ncbi:CoA transferase [Phenylobacterium sp.]|uniref:CoA transferase n=1 Tax=Phenylobacterium sp. TaxID=1871053 RepID=UPI0035B1B783